MKADELGNGSDIDPIVPPVTPPQKIALIGNADFSTEFSWNLVQNVGVFEVFADISSRSSRIINTSNYF